MDNLEIIRSSRKTIAIEITKDCRVLVRAPIKMRGGDIMRFVSNKADWIQKHLETMKERQKAAPVKFTDRELRELTAAAKKDIPERVRRFAPQVGVSVGRVSIRKQKTRWGSCSAKGNVNFNCLLMCCPEEVRDYVVVHELCHRKELNHSDRFWAEVERALPDYQIWRRWLKAHGCEIIGRI